MLTPEILIVAPVLSRPQNARPLVESITETAAVEWRLLFMCSKNDEEEIDACMAIEAEELQVSVVRLELEPGAGDYAKKIQIGYEVGDEAPFVLLAADDLRFHPGWDTNALRIFHEYDAGVVGTVDLGNRGTISGLHSTHPFVSRCYIDQLGGVIGRPGQVYCEEYDHQFVDSELVATAMARGCYAHAHDSVIEHLHPLWRKGEQDDTYRKGSAGFSRDRALFESRRHLWEGARA